MQISRQELFVGRKQLGTEMGRSPAGERRGQKRQEKAKLTWMMPFRGRAWERENTEVRASRLGPGREGPFWGIDT